MPTAEYADHPNGREGLFFSSTLASGYNYKCSEISKVGIAFDNFYNENDQYFYNNTSNKTEKLRDVNLNDIIANGISIGHQLRYNKIELISFIGLYYHNKVDINNLSYFRIGIRYNIFDFAFINLTLRSHGFKAKSIESGLGFIIKA